MYQSILRLVMVGVLALLTHVSAASAPSAADINAQGLEYAQQKKYSEAFNCFKKAAEREDPSAMYNLAYCYANGQGVERNYEKAFEWYRKAAFKGVLDAMNSAGFYYQKGIGVEKNEKNAIIWYERAAKKGHMVAQYNLAFCYQNGIGVDRDDKMAATWYRKAAEQGHAESQNALGFMLNHGKGVEKNPTEAAKWYLKAAEQGHTYAQYNVAICYAKGEGVEKDEKEAARWYHESAMQDDPDAQCAYGRMLLIGSGVEKNEKEAVEWFRKAAHQNHSAAQWFLGYCYHKGLGVNVDRNMARTWYRKAQENGDKDAAQSLENLDKEEEQEKSEQKAETPSEEDEASKQAIREQQHLDILYAQAEELPFPEKGKSLVLTGKSKFEDTKFYRVSGVPTERIQVAVHFTGEENKMAIGEDSNAKFSDIDGMNRMFWFSDKGMGQVMIYGFQLKQESTVIFAVESNDKASDDDGYMIIIGRFEDENPESAAHQVTAVGHKDTDDQRVATSINTKAYILIAALIVLLITVGCVGHVLIISRRSKSKQQRPRRVAVPLQVAPENGGGARYELHIVGKEFSRNIPVDMEKLSHEPLIIGRSRSCSCMIPDMRISSRHCSIGVRRGKLILVDLDSTNGTKVNGEVVPPGQKITLHGGNTVALGSTLINIKKYHA